MVSARTQRILGVVVLLLAIGMGAQYAIQTTHERKVAQCQARVNNAFAVVLKLRGDLADADRAANRTLLESVAKAKTAADVREAELTYLRTQTRLDRERTAHPYPQLPAKACT